MAHIHSGTLVASTVTTVSLDEPYETITVFNRSGSAELFFRLDGVNPTVGGDDCYIVPAAITQESVLGITSIAQTTTGSIPGSTIKLISSGTPTFTVEGT
jgi:hypothetical protein